MRTTIKITLNSGIPFDHVILEYLEGKKNKAGQVKMLAYNQIVMMQAQGRQGAMGEAVHPSSASPHLERGEVQVKKQQGESPEITSRLDKLLKF